MGLSYNDMVTSLSRMPQFTKYSRGFYNFRGGIEVYFGVKKLNLYFQVYAVY